MPVESLSQRRSRKAHADPFEEQTTQCPERQRTDRDPDELPLDRYPLELERKGLRALQPPREQQRDRLLTQTPRRVRQHGGRRGVEPLHVVDSNQQRRPLRQRPERVQERDRDHARLRRPFRRRFLDQERDLQGTPLRLGETIHRLFGPGTIEQVSDDGIRQLRLRPARAARQHLKTITRELDARPP